MLKRGHCLRLELAPFNVRNEVLQDVKIRLWWLIRQIRLSTNNEKGYSEMVQGRDQLIRGKGGIQWHLGYMSYVMV